MNYLLNYSRWTSILESANPQAIADQIQKASSGPGTDEDLLKQAILTIDSADTLNKVNSILANTQKYSYQTVADAISGELGMLDTSITDEINNHLLSLQKVTPTPSDSLISSIWDRVILHEGRKKKVYLDSKKNPTVGVGFNLNRSDSAEVLKSVGANYNLVKSGKALLTDSQIDALLKKDLLFAKSNAERVVPNFTALPLSVQGVVVEMIFNLGVSKFLEFKDFLKYLGAKQFVKASAEMLDSDWASQVKNRATTLANIVKKAVS